MTRRILIAVAILVSVTGTAYAAAPSDPITTVTVKDVQGHGAGGWPTTVVIPVPYGAFQDTSSWRLWDVAAAETVPAQFQIVDRWYLRDNSLRHVAVLFQADVPAGGSARYQVAADGGNVAPGEPVTVADAGGRLTVTTGPIRFTVDKAAGNILDDVFFDANGDRQYLSSERIIVSDPVEHGGRFVACAPASVQAGNCNVKEEQRDTGLEAPNVVVEESGPVRAVIRLEVPAKYNDLNNDHDVADAGEYHRHGYAVRIYAYAGRSDIKVDYQVQNSAKGPNLWGSNGYPRRWANPLYFDRLDLDFNLELGANVTVKTSTASGIDTRSLGSAGVEFGYTFHDQYRISPADGSTNYASCVDGSTDPRNDCDTPGFMAVSDGSRGVQVSYRNMWELWPSGIQVDGGKKLSVQLFPDWSQQHGSNGCSENPLRQCHRDNECSGTCETRFHDVGIYWLDDMRHVYKEVLLTFHGAMPPDAALTANAENFDRHPVPVVPLEHYNATKVTLDLDGLNALTSPIGSDAPLESYTTDQMDEGDPQYRFGWNRWFMPMHNRFYDTGDSGDGPLSAWYFVATESPDDYWDAERMAISELNIRPQWMTDYVHDRDWEALGLTEAGYANGNWRAQLGSSSNNEVYSIPGTQGMANARDGQHFWTWHVLESYYFNYNPWIRDWAEFLKEFRRAKLRGVEPYPATQERAEGHTGFTGWMAYRITGDTTLLEDYHDYIANDRRPSASKVCGRPNNRVSSSSLEKAWWTRALANISSEFRPDDRGNGDWQRWSTMFSFITGYMEWEQHYCVYCYHVDDYGNGQCSTNGNSGGTAWPSPDSQAWYAWVTGKSRFQDQNREFVTSGVGPSGRQPYTGALLWPAGGAWDGRHASRAYFAVEADPRPDRTPPAPPTGVRASTTGNGSITVSWNAVPDADKYFIVVSDRTLIECTSNCASDPQSTDPSNYRNWWAAESVGATRGTSIVLPAVGSGTNYAAVFAFDGASNMSVISEVATSTSGPPDSTPPTAPSNLVANVTSATTVQLTWTGSTDNVGVQAYRVFRDGGLLASTSATSYEDATASPSTTYAYHVTALDTSGNESDASNTAPATTPTLEVPDPPVLEIQGSGGG